MEKGIGARGKPGREREREIYRTRDLSRLLHCSTCKQLKYSVEFTMDTSKLKGTRDYTKAHCRVCSRDNTAIRNACRPKCRVKHCSNTASDKCDGLPSCITHSRYHYRANGYVCSVEGCDKLFHSSSNGKEFCAGHRHRYQRYGDSFPEIPLGHKLPETWEQRESCVYLLCNVDYAVIYIGSSFGNTGYERLQWHLSNQPWSDEIAHQGVISLHATRGQAYEAEESLIKQYSLAYPLYNKTYT